MAKPFADNRASNAPVISLIGAYRERGGRRAIECILALNVKILHHLAGRYVGSSRDAFEGLLQVGYVGPMKVINVYRSDSGAKFSPYAYSKIEGELKHHFRDTALVKRPRFLLEQALESLTELQRKVVYLLFYKDLCQTEIGIKPGLSQHRTSRTVASALKVLKSSEALKSSDGVGSRGLE